MEKSINSHSIKVDSLMIIKIMKTRLLIFGMVLGLILACSKDDDSTALKDPAAIGDIISGGVVFWVDPVDNTQGLVCAFSDEPNPLQWGCKGTDFPNVPTVDCCSGPPVGRGAEVGDGITNTNNILIDCPTAPAALAARALGSDWFLPSINELNEMYINKATLEAITGFSVFSSYYWSSTEADTGSAWRQNFGSGLQDDDSRTSTLNVRAVRAF